MSSYAVKSTNFSVYSAQKFLEGLLQTQLSTNNLYVWIGQTEPWSNDSNPPAPLDTVSEKYNDYLQMIAVKRVAPSDAILVIPAYAWTSSTVYNFYTDLVQITPFYVITPSHNVYICLNNNGGQPSSVEPTSTGTTPVTLADGYIWKFMFQVSSGDVLQFLSSLWIPIYTLLYNDGSLQWSVQATAVPGAIYNIQVTNGGSYLTTPIVTVNGTGTGCTAIANLTGTSVTSITIITPGINYTQATVSFSGSGGATAHAILSPPGGIGFDPANQLKATNIMVDINYNESESGKITTANSYRQFGLLLNPLAYGSQYNFAANVGTLTTNISLTSITGTYNPGDLVTGYTSGATAYVVDFVTPVLRLTQVTGTFIVSETIQNSGATAIGTVSTITYPDIQPNSGLILTTENMSPVLRAPAQFEDIKIVLQF
jgi:hypothetical protein